MKFYSQRKGERFASALTTLGLSNKVYKYYGKKKLANYIEDFKKKHEK